jgi:hypothetical protein
MKYDKKSSALSELKAKRQERERRDMERMKKQKQEKGKGIYIDRGIDYAKPKVKFMLTSPCWPQNLRSFRFSFLGSL